ncbi:lactate utilization protein B [Microbulbifer sp.]|uniref:lactate utilization protein B n=1 Tax=Microbulbifer sp. TaxID=1908541 RepID=UPI003F338A61
MSSVQAYVPDKDFIYRAGDALADSQLQQALAKAGRGFVDKRSAAVARVPNFEAMRDRARAVRQKALQDLDIYLLHFEQKVTQAGGQVHWAETPAQMREIVLQLCAQHAAARVTKGKSMVGEEVYLNEALEEAGITPFETDLGEYILQLAKEPPSHIVAPALHKTRAQIQDLFLHHHPLGERDLSAVEAIVDEARQVIRDRFLSADIGITGANLLIAETGTVAIATNEGNGDLTATLPRAHIVTTTIDRVVPTWEDASAILRVLARSATGQPTTTYTSFFTGARGDTDKDGPEAFHVVLLDNRRSQLLGSEYQEMLHCIRCGACMNHCPVYQTVGGHTYDSVYPGPMGAVLTPLLRHREGDYQLPNASTFCGRCESVCPVRIPLPDLMRKLRIQEQREAQHKGFGYWITRAFCALAASPRLYGALTSIGTRVAALQGARRGRFSRLPLLGGWTAHRDFPAPQGGSFQSQWRRASTDTNEVKAKPPVG